MGYTVGVALETMKRKRIRRVPVVGFDRLLLGIVSLNDIAMEAGPGKPVSGDAVLTALQAIGAHHRHLAPQIVAV